MLADAAHHIGNWVDGIPEWYDYERDCFHSYHIGTRTVIREPKFAYEVAEHIMRTDYGKDSHIELELQGELDLARIRELIVVPEHQS